ncbi:hypothetical protein SLS62_002475 [Diatrype stigma]|uniref:Cryptic loci regulator 2 N-terminal domain-containing protein n=1 Tax=Diatrype stigma TaxID=117547 RepID=A0AAN9YS87_9PEZI
MATPIYLIKGIVSDGRTYHDDKYPKDYNLVANNHEMARQWLVKLGNMFRDQWRLPDNRIYKLEGFPANYHLRCKFRANQGKKAGRAPADYYLYGWPNPDPDGPPKPFRSANEAFQHLVWLYSSTIKGIPDGLCGCRLCTEAGKRTHPTAGSAPSTGMSYAQPPPQLQAPPATAQQLQAPPATAQQLQAPPAIAQQLQAPPVWDQPQVPPANGQPVPGHLPGLFRVGEIVWYQLGNAWRLGLVLPPHAVAVPPGPGRWPIRPLAHRFLAECADVYKTEKELRPYLAFSVPNVNPALFQRLDGKTMGEIDWNTTQREVAGGDKHKMMSLGLEASKVAATTVDHGYSAFNEMNNSVSSLPSLPKRTMGTSLDSVHSIFNAMGPTSQGQCFGGIFLGCERIELLDAVRVSVPDVEQGVGLVMQVRAIRINEQGELRFHGDLYCLEQRSPQEESGFGGFYAAPLSSDMIEEASFWNHVKGNPAVPYQWVYQKMIIADEDTIRGRFYPTSRLRSLIDQEALDNDIRNGTIGGASAFLNNRRSSRGIYVGRQRNRFEAIKDALPEGTYPLTPSSRMFGDDVIEN